MAGKNDKKEVGHLAIKMNGLTCVVWFDGRYDVGVVIGSEGCIISVTRDLGGHGKRINCNCELI